MSSMRNENTYARVFHDMFNIFNSYYLPRATHRFIMSVLYPDQSAIRCKSNQNIMYTKSEWRTSNRNEWTKNQLNDMSSLASYIVYQSKHNSPSKPRKCVWEQRLSFGDIWLCMQWEYSNPVYRVFFSSYIYERDKWKKSWIESREIGWKWTDIF